MSNLNINKIYNMDLIELGQMAELERFKHNPENLVTFVVDRNINYTNICSCKCKFCAFYKDSADPESYVLPYDEIKLKIAELIQQNGTQILLQGGLNKDIKVEYYFNLLSSIRRDFPSITIHAFSPPEIDFISRTNNISVDELIKEFINCGLSSIPGGGAEILSDKIRKKISPNKISSGRWIEIMKIAHLNGLKSTATMVTGFGESYEDIFLHLEAVKKLQSETEGFTAFINWTFQSLNTAIRINKLTAYDYLRTLAVSRVFLDNIQHFQASWVTQGLNIAQMSLFFGANDFGGTMLEENVVKSAGTVNITNQAEVISLIKNAGFLPAKRSTQYEILKKYY